MDIGEGGGGDGGGGEDRDADFGPQALSHPPLTLACIPKQGPASDSSTGAPAKELSSQHDKVGERGAEGSQAGGEIQVGGQKDGHHEDDRMCQKRWMKEMLPRQNKEGHGTMVLKSETGGLPKALSSSRGGEEEEEAISNQSQTKSKCSLLPQQSQQSASSSMAKTSGKLDSKTAASPKSSQTPPTSPKASPFLSCSPKHFTCPSYSSGLQSDMEAKDITGDQGWISGFPQSFKSQQSCLAFPLAGMEGANAPAEEDGPAGISHFSISSGNGSKAPEPNDSHLEMDVERENEGEQKEAVPKNLNQELSPNSLTSHMTVMHSRNSCKTLKCPKCNWHYKSQHTLQLHMKEKHPETGGHCVCTASSGKCVCGTSTRGVCGYCSSGKPHPRLARGETYACGYKPYRCEVCDYATSSKGNLSIHMQSDKHLNNVQNGGHANGQMHTSHVNNNNSSSSNGATMDEPTYKHPLSITTSNAQPAKLTQPAHSPSHGKRWRCDVCDYETSIARNLRIHTTSEKHTHNMLRLQRGYYLSHCRSLAPHLKHLQSTGGELSLNMRLTTQQVTEQPVPLGSTLTPSPSPSPSPPPALSFSPTGPLSQGVFQCLVCSCFSSDSLESMEQHLNAPRSLPQSEWCSLVTGGCHCRLCGYTTPLRANFSLHCQTDRHRTRYQLAAHVQEGGNRGQEGSVLIAKGNPIQLRCNLCEYATSSLEKIQGHSRSSNHESSVRVYRFLQQYDGEVDGGTCVFHCLLCNHSSSSKLQVLKHSQTQTHQQRESLLQLQPMGGEELAAIFTIRKKTVGVMGELNEEDTENSSEVTTGPLDQTKDHLGVKQSDLEPEEKVKAEVDKKESFKRQVSECREITTKRLRTHQQSENQQTVQCPLCQDKMPYGHLRPHLTHVHSVAQDCVDKLISTVTTPMEQVQPHLENEIPSDLCMDDTKSLNKKHEQTDRSHTTDSLTSDDSPKNKSISGEHTEGNTAAPKDVTALLTPPLEDNTTQPSNGRLAPQSLTQTPPSSPTGDPPPLSDRHGYRFRCSRCSLAFPTQEKLQLHWQYHAMRAATECPLCSRQCRSQEALQRHMQNTHSQPDNAQNTASLFPISQNIEHTKISVQQDLSLSPQAGQEACEGEDEEMEGVNEEEDKMEGKEQKEDCQTKDNQADETGRGVEELAEAEKGLNDEIPSEIRSISLIKKSSNPTMDRYLDPSRPYKCTICSESFTQKTILLVHYNSVSHLHRARRALQDSNTGVSATEATRGQDPRPYRCKLCGVGYSQSSTLDIHLRSVLHQTRARAAQHPVANNSAPISASTTNLPAITDKEMCKGFPSTRKPDVASSSSGLVSELQSTSSTEGQQAKKRVAELLASRNQLLLMQQQQLAQAQAQAHLQHTALLQAQVMQHLSFGPESLFQHFSLAPDNLLSLQQQLLPFYFPGEMKLNTEMAIKSLEHNQPEAAKTTLSEQVKREAKKENNPQADEKLIQNQSSLSDDSPPQKNIPFDSGVEHGSSSSSIPNEKEYNKNVVDEKGELSVPVVKNEHPVQENDSSTINVQKVQCPPPRVPYAAVNGEALRTLLQSYGYELALQYIQSRHRHQQQIATQMLDMRNEYSDIQKTEFYVGEQKEPVGADDGKMQSCNKDIKNEVEEIQNFIGKHNQGDNEDTVILSSKEKGCCGRGEMCKDCGKFFSDAMILKSHEEYIHRQVLPTAALERFSREYRLQYDQLYPLKENKSGEDSSHSTTVAIPDISSESQPLPEADKVQAKTSPPSFLSDPETKSCATTEDQINASIISPTLSSSHFKTIPQKELPLTVMSPPVASQNASLANSKNPPLPKIPRLPLSQVPIPPITLPKLPIPPIPFPVELPLIPPVVMQSVGLQPPTWLDSSVSPELTKFYQSQLLGQQTPINPTVISQPSQLSPTMLSQPTQVNTPLLSQPAQSSTIPTGQEPQVSPTLLEQQQGKRTRTRISEDQLAILRKHFDINSLPSEEELIKISGLSGLPQKVIKHWFRNTLFKERQRDKDSPYNFNNPPTTALEELREEVTQNPSLTLSPSSPSPAPTDTSHQILLTDIHRSNTHKGRRSSRTRFTEKQLEMLQGVFEATPYPREEEYDRLSALLSLPNRVIVVWFQNARQRARKSQDRGTDDGIEEMSQLDILRKGDGYHKNDDTEDNSNGDEEQNDSHNENSMDLTYEYYNHPDSPVLDSSTVYTDSKHLMDSEESIPTVNKQENKTTTLQTNQTEQKEMTVINNESKETVWAIQNVASPKAEKLVQTQQESPTEHSQSQSSVLSQITVPDNPSSVCESSQEYKQSSSLNTSFEKPAATSPNLPLSSESEKSPTSEPDAPFHVSSENQSLNGIPVPNLFQCTLCPMSLSSFQMWQEHQTRHLLAAQSQVQLLHSGFTDRTLPYMMIHSNHSLMASQMLSGAMTQLHPNTTNPIISHLNSTHVKNSLADLSETSLKQNPKLMSESSFDAQRYSRDVEEEHRRDKRQRTTITPEQLEVLYQRYSLDSNPTRGVLEGIAQDVGLTRRVVQVWFQNTRARERKGQFRSMGPGSSFNMGLNHLRCPFCRALFKVKSALDAHMRSRHWAEAERAGYNLLMSNGSSGTNVVAVSSVIDKPGPSISFVPDTSITISSNEQTVKAPITFLSTTNDINNQAKYDDFEEDDECEEGSSVTDQGPLSAEESGGPSSDWSETLQPHHHQHQRQRTQMSHFQVLQLRDFYKSHRTPNRHECEALGRELGLPHRVVQVWFQNARAKEKRARTLSSDSAEREQAELTAGAGERDRA
ncbi:zinc finger homeobox protein 3-like [Corythoichthys intestinalis]|uniref:zinc finger homeobox protein 3-like n=1 Tax=Corythoichthys intestinalis TaxID=161448 RepID=UPI0025A5437A|nr:zinc finger homeobox protein 3-like [Corythoichthys intestinalis]XP_061812952.1 zinc finger homeobox protein 3-like [Nerophis lumbriciformis]